MSEVKDKERLLKVAREKQLAMYKGTPIGLSDLSAENLQVRKEWHDMFKVQKEKYFQLRILSPAKI